MSAEREQLESGIAALEGQRGSLGDPVVDAAVSALRQKIATLVPAATLADAAQHLRQVTILFLDVVGSTTLSQSLDPEEIGAVMDGALSRGTTIVETHQGRVLQYAGDSLLAVFGAQEAREDDAERAVRCGLALLTLGRAPGAGAEARQGHAGFDVRIGIHTGGVLLGGGVDDGDSIRGIAVNIAARMEQTAPVGALRISQDTFTQVRGLFDVAPQDPLFVKGVDVPITSYLVQRVKPRAFRGATRGIEGVVTRMIGRDAELETLQDAFMRLFEPGAGLERVTVVAEAGVGKSRLLDEVRNWAEARPEPFVVFQARAVPQTQGQAYGLLRDLLSWRFGIGDNDAADVAKQKLEAGLIPLFVQDEGEAEAEAHAHLLGQLIGLDYDDSRHIRGIRDDGRQIRSRGFHAAAQAMRRIASQGRIPLVVYLDDLHWADDPSLDFLETLGRIDRDVPMLLIALTRPTLFERRPAASSRADELRVDLHPLDETASSLLADELLKQLPEVPVALRDLITARADGNPFYMEELIRMLIDRKAIDTTGAQWTLDADKLGSLKVPPTLTGVLQARLDGLPQSERHALQLASVIGQTFWDAALAHVEAAAATQLARLSERELVSVKDADDRSDGIREYAFCHQIFHHVTYDTVLKRIRRAAHARTAQWLAEHSGTRARALLGTAAEHYERAGDTANAAEFHARAAEHATSTYANDTALDHAARALMLADTDAHALRWRLHASREKIHDVLGQRGEQMQAIVALLELAEALDDDNRRAQAAVRRANIAHRTGDYQTAGKESRRAELLAQKVGDEELAMLAIRLRAISLAYLGDPVAGRTIAEVAFARAGVLGLVTSECHLCNALAICAEEEGSRQSLERYTELGLALTRKIGDRRTEATALNNLAGTLVLVGDFAAARRHLEEALPICRAVGHRMLEGVICVTLSDVALHFGDPAQALALAEAGVAIMVETDARLHQIEAFDSLGNAELALGRLAQAAAAFDRSEKIARELGRTAGLLRSLAAQVRVAMASDDLTRAAERADAILSAAGFDPLTSFGRARDECGNLLDEDARVRLTLHQLWSRTSDLRADAVLVDAHRVLMKEADGIDDDALKHSFLTQVAEHREIVRLFAGRSNAPAATA